jgi:hypothetical protein
VAWKQQRFRACFKCFIVFKKKQEMENNIQKDIKLYNIHYNKMKIYEKKICEYCAQIIKESLEKKDKNTLINLMNDLPKGAWRLYIFKAICKIDDSL